MIDLGGQQQLAVKSYIITLVFTWKSLPYNGLTIAERPVYINLNAINSSRNDL